MAYTPFDNTKPDGTVNTGPETLTAIRENLQAMSDAVMMGVMPGWNMSVSGGTAEEPDEVVFAQAPEVIKAMLTWGSSGGSEGNVVQIVFTQSPDGVTFNAIGTVTITYDADGNATASTWSV